MTPDDQPEPGQPTCPGVPYVLRPGAPVPAYAGAGSDDPDRYFVDWSNYAAAVDYATTRGARAAAAESGEFGPPDGYPDPEPPADPNYLARQPMAFRVQLFDHWDDASGLTPVVTRGAETDADLAQLLFDLAVMYVGRAKVSWVTVWDAAKQQWHHPDGRAMPDAWQGNLPLSVQVKAGSVNY